MFYNPGMFIACGIFGVLQLVARGVSISSTPDLRFTVWYPRPPNTQSPTLNVTNISYFTLTAATTPVVYLELHQLQLELTLVNRDGDCHQLYTAKIKPSRTNDRMEFKWPEKTLDNRPMKLVLSQGQPILPSIDGFIFMVPTTGIYLATAPLQLQVRNQHNHHNLTALITPTTPTIPTAPIPKTTPPGDTDSKDSIGPKVLMTPTVPSADGSIGFSRFTVDGEPNQTRDGGRPVPALEGIQCNIGSEYLYLTIPFAVCLLFARYDLFVDFWRRYIINNVPTYTHQTPNDFEIAV